MNRQGEGKIDWCDYTWNPISGCLHGCSYCYLKRIDKRFGSKILTPKFNPERLKDIEKSKKLKKGDKVFVGSSGDMFGRWVDMENILATLDVCRSNPDIIFQFLTKHPDSYRHFIFPENSWCGTTEDGTLRTVFNISKLKKYVPEANIKFISFEPLLAEVEVELEGIDWIIIGSDSNSSKKTPDLWADNLIRQARNLNISVWVKDNYKYHTKIKEFPSG